MNTTKPWWQSRTAWAAAVSILAGLLGLAGVNLDARLQDELVTLLTGAAELGAGGVRPAEPIGKVSLIGAGMRTHPGVAADMFDSLSEAGINIEIISTSPIRVSCVVARDRLTDAVRAVHDKFNLGD